MTDYSDIASEMAEVILALYDDPASVQCEGNCSALIGDFNQGNCRICDIAVRLHRIEDAQPTPDADDNIDMPWSIRAKRDGKCQVCGSAITAEHDFIYSLRRPRRWACFNCAYVDAGGTL